MSSRLLDDFGHEVKTVLDRRGDRLEGGMAVAFGHGVFAQTLVDLLRVSHRRNAASIHRLHRGDEIENRVELALRGLRLRIVDFNARKACDALDVVRTEGHGST